MHVTGEESPSRLADDFGLFLYGVADSDDLPEPLRIFTVLQRDPHAWSDGTINVGVESLTVAGGLDIAGGILNLIEGTIVADVGVGGGGTVNATGTVDGNVTTAGDFNLPGELTVLGDVTQTAGSVELIDGWYGYGVLFADGYQLDGGTLTFGSLHPGSYLNVEAGGLTIAAGGTLSGAGDIRGDVTNGGTIEIGGPGVSALGIDGDFTNSSAGAAASWTRTVSVVDAPPTLTAVNIAVVEGKKLENVLFATFTGPAEAELAAAYRVGATVVSPANSLSMSTTATLLVTAVTSSSPRFLLVAGETEQGEEPEYLKSEVLAFFTTSNPQDVGDRYRAWVDWGDGTLDHAEVVGTGGSLAVVVPAGHAYVKNSHSNEPRTGLDVYKVRIVVAPKADGTYALSSTPLVIESTVYVTEFEEEVALPHRVFS